MGSSSLKGFRLAAPQNGGDDAYRCRIACALNEDVRGMFCTPIPAVDATNHKTCATTKDRFDVHSDLKNLEFILELQKNDREKGTYSSVPSTSDMATMRVLKTSFTRCAMRSKFISWPVFQILNLHRSESLHLRRSRRHVYYLLV